jgi:hypothetical protein
MAEKVEDNLDACLKLYAKFEDEPGHLPYPDFIKMHCDLTCLVFEARLFSSYISVTPTQVISRNISVSKVSSQLLDNGRSIP